jgi:ABC-2 type transport system permease protein
LAACFVSGWLQYTTTAKQVAAAQRDERERWLSQGRKYEHTAAHYGVFAFRPPTLLSSFDPGVNAYLGTSVFLEAHRQNLFGFRPAADGLNLRRLGEISTAVTLQILIPLLIIILGFRSVVGEREDGTLHHVWSLGIRKPDLIWGKVLGFAGPLIVLLGLTSLAGAAVLIVNAGAFPSTDLWFRLLLSALVYASYFAVFVAMTLSASAVARTSRQSLLILMGFWCINCFILPPALTEIAARSYPQESGLELAMSVREGTQRLAATSAERRAALEQRLLSQFGVRKISDVPLNVNGLAMLETEEAQDRLQNEIFDQLYAAYRQQDQLFQAGGFLSPLSAVQALSMGLAGSDFMHHRYFADAAESYRQRMLRVLNQSMADANPAQMREFAGTGIRVSEAGRDVWERVPPFKYVSVGFSAIWGYYAVSMVVLGAWVIGSCIVASLLLSRMKLL